MRFLLSRGFVLTLIALLLAVIGLSYAVPQAFAVPAMLLEKWRAGHPLLLPAVDALGLHHVFTTPWFAVLALLFLLSLSASCLRQLQGARRLSRLCPEGGGVAVARPVGEARGVLLAHGYRRVSCSGPGEKFVRHPWGYWGNFCFHLGMVLLAGAVLMIVLTQQRGMYRLENGQVVTPDYPWSAEEHGLLVPPLQLPAPVRMDNLTAEFYETDDMKGIGSRLSFFPPGAAPESFEISVNHPAWYRGMKIYQELQSGHLFHLRFTAPSGEQSGQTLLFMLPARRDQASYNEFRLPGLPYLLKGKYFADAGKRRLEGGSPLLVLRFYDGERVLAETRLQEGESGELAGYRVTLERAPRWGGVAFTDTKGIEGIFLGFLVIVCGGLLHYFTVPREALLRADGHGAVISWRATRFAEFYQEEQQQIMTALGMTREPGNHRDGDA